jgi:hypothetical protein
MSLVSKLRKIRSLSAALKGALSDFLRLRLMASRKPGRRHFVAHPRPLGLPKGLSYDKIEELINALESPTTNDHSQPNS